MTSLARFAPGDDGARWLLAAALVIGGLVAAAALVDRAVLRRRAAARHGLWLVALVLVVASPILVAVADRSGPGWSIPLGRAPVGPPAAPAPVVSGAAPTLPVPPGPPIEAPREADPPPPLVDRLPPLGPPPLAEPEAPRPGAAAAVAVPAWTRADSTGLAVLAWLTGVALGLGRIGRGYGALRRLRPDLRPLDLDAHAATLAEVREALNLGHLPPILTAPGVAGPFAAGLARPYVVVPGDLAGRPLRDVLIHEVAHVVRRDLWVGLLQRLAGVAFWPHPAIHHLNRRLNRAREEVCDNFVLRLGDPRGYARTLLALTERRPAAGRAHPSLGLTGAGCTLADRVAGLLDPERDRMTRSPLRVRLLAGALLLGVGLPLATLRLDRPTVAAVPATPVPLPPPTLGPLPPPVEDPPGEPGRPVTGVVVDAAGRPVAGAIVRPVRRNKAPDGATTDAAGRFTLTLRGYMLLSEELIAEADGGALLGLGKFEESRTAAPAEPVRITLKPGRAVTVRVKDAAGAPVPGAAVETVDYGCTRQGTTGPDGTATLRIPENGHARWVIAHKGGVGFDYFENYQASNARDLEPLPADLTLTLDGAATVRVKAVDTQGRPVAGVEFAPWLISKPGKLDRANIAGALMIPATTGPDGVATFDWLPAGVAGGITFLERSADYSCPDPPSYQGKAPAELTARLLRNTPVGGVVRRADGQVARDALIQAEGRGDTNHYCRLYTRTGADGRYTFKAYPDQKYIIATLDPNAAATSRTGFVVVEGQAQDGLDLRIVPGTLVQGLVTRGDDRAPAPGTGVTLIQKGEAMPLQPAANAVRPLEGDSRLVRWFTTDDQGRYKIQVGPGNYEVYASDSPRDIRALLITSPDAATLSHDFHLTRPARPTPFNGRAVERRADGDRPVPGAIVQVLPAGGYSGSKARADADGLFRCYKLAEVPLVIYARSPDGTRAGFSTFAPKVAEGVAVVGPASRVSGRVVDPAGRPRADYRVQVQLRVDPNLDASGRLAWSIQTDGQGRYTADGIAVGTRGEVSIRAEEPPFSSSRAQAFTIPGEEPVELPDLAIPSEPARPAEPKAAGPAAPPTRRITPVVTTRAEVEALIRAVGRDAATPELIDRVMIPFLPQNSMFYDLARVRRLVIDDRFVGRVDAFSLDRFQHPADTETLVAVALVNYAFDDAGLTSYLETLDQGRRHPVIAIEGTVDDAATGRPVAGAIVQAPNALTRTDERGRFVLRTRSNPGLMIQYYVAAEGFGLREVMLAPAEVKRQEIHLAAAVPLEGQVLDPGGKPIAGATLDAWINRPLVLGRERQDRDGGSSARTVRVRSDEQGGFSVPYVPPFDEHFSLRAYHPDHQDGGVEVAEPTTAAPLVVRLQPGAVVGGTVVDEQGRGVAGAWVRLRPPASDRDEAAVATDEQGRYRFGTVKPGRRNLVVTPDQFAPVLIAVVASLDRPVENQVVVPAGLYVRGQVVGDDGQPVAGAMVGWVKSATDPGFSFDRFTKADAAGAFKLGPLPPGAFQITGLAASPRREGKVTAQANQTDALIRLVPAPR